MSYSALRARLSQATKDGISATLHFAGVTRRRSRRQLSHQALVLMYHRVLPPERLADTCSSSSIVVTPQTFELHMRVLRRHFNPVSAAQLLDMLEGRSAWMPNSCLVTFDDGWYDNHAFALPVLRRHGVPAVIFVATSYIGGKRSFWQEETSRRLAAAAASAERKSLLAAAGAAELLDAPAHDLREPIRAVISARKSLPRAELERWIAQVEAVVAGAGLAPEHFGEDRFMTWDEVRALRDGGLVTVGSHADSHTPLTALAPAACRAELERSRQILERELGDRVDTVAYPDGAHDAEIAGLARAAGYRLGLTTLGGFAARGDDTLRIRRVNIYDRATRTEAGFMSRVSALF
jgi:peptidoglycan/xylan/chitin deacetylase (PgdA/CDA1 family)